MKATGIVRRIDDLGRVVVPKEIRRILRIREGDPLEIYTGNGGEVILDNGYHKVTYAYQKPENVSDLHLYISGVAEELDEVPVELTIIE